jgi:phosphoserine aminotransferase
MAKRKYNFNPGPATLPLDALEEAQKNMVEYKSTGMSYLELSHRSKDFEEILASTQDLLRSLMEIPATHEIIFLGGGASLHFCMIPMNFLPQGKKACYLITGNWSELALKEAKLLGETVVGASSKEENFRRIPKAHEIKIAPDSVYVHMTSNNTIYGTQWKSFPETGNIPLIADMSSDIFSRRVDLSKFAVIYGGAQKNLGPAGVTVVIINKDFVGQAKENLPTMLKYKTHVEKNSLYNTPPVFAIYMMKLVLEWGKKIGGLKKIEQINEEKGRVLYGVVDEYPDFFKGTVDPDSRSLMNATIRLPNEDLEKKFISEAAAKDFHGLKGHRSVGGIRVSMYNALPLEGIEKLAEFMRDFVKKSG